jgi:hypothetical protein
MIQFSCLCQNLTPQQIDQSNQSARKINKKNIRRRVISQKNKKINKIFLVNLEEINLKKNQIGLLVMFFNKEIQSVLQNKNKKK